MLEKLCSLKRKHFELESKLREETKRPLANEFEVKEIKKKKLKIKDTIMRLVRKKSVHRKKRYYQRAKRLTRIGNPA